MQTEKIKVDRYSLSDFILEIKKGQIRIPRFQREFVWERTRIQKLLDSMYKEYPIGTIFLWQAPSEYNHLLRDIEDLNQPPIRQGAGYTLILDGQQRLTSLYAVTNGLIIDGEDYGKIVVDLSSRDPDKLFQYRKPDNQRWVAIKDLILADELIFDIYNNLPDDERKKMFTKTRSLILKYPFSVVIVSSMNLEDAIEIFERINQQGKRLSRYDLISASVLTNTFDLRERTEDDITSKLQQANFGTLPETSIPQSLALNIRGRTETTTQLNLTSEEIETNWQRTVECLMLAVEFARSNLGVERADFLPYDGMIPVLAHYFFHAKSNSVLKSFHREQLEYWFWRVAFSERYSGASQTRMTEDANWIRKLVDEDKEIEFSVSLDVSSLTQGTMRSTTSAIRNGVLCLLNLLNPRHFESGAEIDLSGDYFSSFTRAEKHHIFPKSILNAEGYSTKDIHRIPNFCFIPSDLNKRISDKLPSVYIREFADKLDEIEFERIMKTHLIPIHEGSGIWNDDYQIFLQQRAQLIIDEVNSRAGVVIRIDEEERNPVIDKVEQSLRDLIDTTLSNEFGADYWRDGISSVAGDVHKSVMSRIDTYVSRTPGTSKSQFNNLRLRLDFIDVSDYEKIITRGKNWQLFSITFRSKADCRRYLGDFRDFRNATKHGRDVDTVLDLNAQAAITWLAQAMHLDLSKYGITW